MRYCLWKAVLGRTPKVELERAEYDEIRQAWNAIIAVSNIEEEWDRLIHNYIEFETELLQAAVHSMVQSRESWSQFQDIRSGFSRRLSNLLQSCRSYLDHVPHHLKSLKISGLAEAFATERNMAYDANLSYRFLEALRNYAQHRGVPMHGTTFNSSWIDGHDEQIKNMRHIVTCNVDLQKIRQDKQFKEKVLSEIGNETDSLDVTTLTRGYIEGLGAVHSALRKSLADDFTKWKTLISSTIDRYSAANDGNVLGLSVAEFRGDGTLKASIGILGEVPKRVEEMVRRNGSLVNLTKQYVSSELIPPKLSKR